MFPQTSAEAQREPPASSPCSDPGARHQWPPRSPGAICVPRPGAVARLSTAGPTARGGEWTPGDVAV